MPRLFFALEPDAVVRARLAELVRSVPLQRARPIPAVNYHVTLAFLGSISTERVPLAVDAVTEVQSSSFDFALDQLESWRRSGILCVTATTLPPLLLQLVLQLQLALRKREFEIEERPFRAHVTLARQFFQRYGPEPLVPILWSVREFVLMSSQAGSQGSEYSVVQRWPLQ